MMSVFRCDDEPVFGAIDAAIGRGVSVEVLLTARAAGSSTKLGALRERLRRCGAAVHTYADPDVKYHAKYLVVDEGPALIGSFNFTVKCFDRTFDAAVVTYDADVVEGLQRLMSADRRREALPVLFPSRLIVGPEQARRRVTDLIMGAKRSIRIVDKKLSDPEMTALLAQKQRDGVAVDLYTSSWIDGQKSHGKLMLIDDRQAIVGALALSTVSLDRRRELAVIVDDAAAVADTRQLFGILEAGFLRR